MNRPLFATIEFRFYIKHQILISTPVVPDVAKFLEGTFAATNFSVRLCTSYPVILTSCVCRVSFSAFSFFSALAFLRSSIRLSKSSFCCFVYCLERSNIALFSLGPLTVKPVRKEDAGPSANPASFFTLGTSQSPKWKPVFNRYC